jgi:uncharacterized protein
MTPGTVHFANASVRVAIVEKPDEMARGLMDRTSLPENEGMLFWMGRRDDHAFWMKRTRIPLDLIFINVDRVVGMLTLEPLDERRQRVGRPSTNVLEVNGGWANRHGIAIGDRVTISLD